MKTYALSCLVGDGEVYVWDLNTRDCIHRFVDDGCIDGTAITVSKNGQYLATGYVKWGAFIIRGHFY